MTLIDRLSKMDGPDREVDALIVKHFGLENECPYWLHRFTRSTPMHLTASVDAAIALAERVLPGRRGDVEFGKPDDEGLYCARIYLTDRAFKDFHKDPAIALCIAILRAKGAANGE